MPDVREGESRANPVAVQYENVSVEYFERRGLKRHARMGSLWVTGGGAVTSGDFFGWNFGLGVGGFGGMLLATLVATLIYLGLCLSVAELSAALPHTGGAYSFARAAFGPWGGYLTGLAENMEYILAAAVIVVGSGGYLGALIGTSAKVAPLWWLVVARYLRLFLVAEHSRRRAHVPLRCRYHAFGADCPGRVLHHWRVCRRAAQWSE